jgi:hypothetical protein
LDNQQKQRLVRRRIAAGPVHLQVCQPGQPSVASCHDVPLRTFWNSVVRPFAIIQEHLPEIDPLGIVDIEDCDGSAAGLRAAEEDCAVPLEVTLPRLATGVEKPHHVGRQRVSAAEIRAFVEVTSMAAPTSILGIVTATVLFG